MRVMISALAAILVAASSAALAQSRGPLFVSPMGEPFRSQDGAAPIQAWFSAVDADGDGKLSREEFVAQAQAFFAVLDANRDDRATSFESTSLYREQAPEVLSTRTAPLPTRRPPNSGMAGIEGRPPREESPLVRSGAALYGLLDAVEPVMSCDADLSRWVTAQEFEACATRRFALLDTDGDGLFALQDSERAMAFAEMSAE